MVMLLNQYRARLFKLFPIGNDSIQIKPNDVINIQDLLKNNTITVEKFKKKKEFIYDKKTK